MTKTPPLAIRLQDIRRVFRSGTGTITAVDGATLTVPRGQILALLGHNGAGKTTLLDIILGLGSPTSGTVEVLGSSPADAVAAGRISALLQTGGLLHDLTVGETLRSVAGLHGVTGRIDEIIARTDLEPILGRRVGRCSGGEQQRLKFALALLPDPEVLILDEPTAGMDAAARRGFWATMRTEADEGRTILFATHYLEEAEEFAERTVVMARGRIIADDSTAALRGSIAGRELSAHLPAGDAPAGAVLAAMRERPEVRDLGRDGPMLRLISTDSDATARALLSIPGVRDLEIHAPTLETAYLALTGKRSDTPVGPTSPTAGARSASPTSHTSPTDQEALV